MITQSLVKMKTFLLILAVLGATTALIPKHEYFYYYTAETSIGIPEVAPSYSIVGLRSNVSIQVPSKDHVIIQMKEVEVASEVRKIEGGMNGYPIQKLTYRPVDGVARALEEPFEVYLRKESGDIVMEVPKTDKEWLTNIRKSIANIIRVYPVIDVPSVKMSSSKVHHEFYSKEYTIFGHCKSHYTVKKISYQYLPMPGGRSGPRIGYDICKNGAFNVTRSINFNQCSDMSMFQHTGISNRSSAGHVNHGSVDSRSSVAHYTICGKEGEMQIQNMTTQGLFTLNPFGYETEKMQSISNQTFRLSYIRSLQTPTQLKTSKAIRTWLMAVASPYTKSSTPERPWVNFYNKNTELYPFLSEAVVTGESYENKKKHFHDNILQIIKKVAEILHSKPQPIHQTNSQKFDTEESQAPKLMQMATRMVRSLEKQYLKDIWDTLQKGSKDMRSDTEIILYTDCLAASGSSAAISVLLDGMKSGVISEYRAKTLFMTFTNNIVNPEIIPQLVKYAMSLNIAQKPYLVSIVNVNLASAVRRVCTDTKISQYSVPQPILGNRRCDPSSVLNEYFNYLEQQLQHSTKPFERSIYVEAIANLGTVRALPLIKEIIAGQHGRNASIRVVGIYALLHYRIPDAPATQISKILTPIFEDFMEDMQIRQTAILVHATWNPDVAFWQRLATLSWRDQSKEVGSFIYSLISSTAKSTNPKLSKQAEYAKHALSRAKPYPPSFMASYSYLWSQLSPSYHLTTDFSIVKISSNESVVPREVFSYLYNAYGGLDYTLVEQCGLAFNADELFFRVLEKIDTAYQKVARNPRMSNPQQYMDFFKIIKEELSFKGRDISPYQLFYVLRLFDHMEVFAPIDQDILKFVNNGQDVISKLLKGTEVNLVKYFDATPIEMYIPLESGLPMAYRISYPIIFSVIGDAKLRIPNVSQPRLMDVFTASEVEFGINKNAKFISTYVANLAAIVPWDKSEVYTETYMTTNFNDPSQLNVTLINSVNMDYVNTTVSMYVKPNIEAAFPVIHMHNIPVVGIRSMWPDQKEQRIQQLYVAPNNRPVEKIHFDISKAHTGIDGYLKYNGDIINPFTFGNVYDRIQNPQKIVRSHSPTSKRWDFELVVDPSRSQTKSVNISTTVWIPSTILSFPMKNYTHVNAQNVDRTRDYPFGVISRVHLNGTVNRYYEGSIGVSKQFDLMNKHYGVRVTAHRSPLPGYSDQKYAICANVTASAPKLYDYFDLKHFSKQEREVETRYQGQLYMGENCQNSRFGDFHGHLLISDEERTRIQNDIGENGDYTPFEPLAPYYDRSQFTLNYDSSKIQPFFRNVTYMIYDTVRGWAFPHIYFGYTNVHNKENQIKVEAKRLIKSGTWNGTIHMPKETAKFESQHIPKQQYNIVPTNGLSPLAYECVINNKGVRTFDDVSYDLPTSRLSDCWTVAVVNKKFPERLQILTRRPSSGYEVMIASSDHQINIEVSKEKILVNGKPVSVHDQVQWVHDSRGMQFAQVISQWGYHEVSVPGNVTVVVNSNEVKILPFKSLKGKVNGICGDFNSESENELIGPENCYYQNMTRFEYSWTTSQGPNCDKVYWKKAQQEVDQFQKQCAKAYPRGLAWELKKEKRCDNFVYPIQELEEVVCVCTNSVDYCLPGCTKSMDIYSDELYYCYFYKGVPQDVKPYISRGYLTQFPHMLPDITRVLHTRQAYSCS